MFSPRTIDNQNVISLQSYYSSLYAKILLDLTDLSVGISCGLGIVGGSLHLAAHLYIELYLGFCARGTYGNLCAVLREILYHIGGDRHIYLNSLA